MTFSRLYVPDLLQSGWKHLTFKPFRAGIDICHLCADAVASSHSSTLVQPGFDDPVVALLRYSAGASVPRHRHRGIETILVLEGSQSDEQGLYDSGSLVINPVGSEHSVWSENGCVVLIQWDKPVEFV